jgi:hypothetical protein
MLDNFKKDLARGKVAEAIVKDVFASLTSDYDLIDVSNYSAFFYRGDIKAVDKKSG